jgi:hypothetical protein
VNIAFPAALSSVPEAEPPLLAAAAPSLLEHLSAKKLTTVKVPKVKVPKVPKVKVPKVHVAAVAKKAPALKLPSTANSLKTMVQREAVHVVGSVVQRGVSNQIVQEEKDHAAAKKAAALQAAQQAAPQAVPTPATP